MEESNPMRLVTDNRLSTRGCSVTGCAPQKKKNCAGSLVLKAVMPSDGWRNYMTKRRIRANFAVDANQIAGMLMRSENAGRHSGKDFIGESARCHCRQKTVLKLYGFTLASV